jgi:3-oxoacyl-[acyl-carrier-protein] synthase III
MKHMTTRIIGTGSYIPEKVVPNSYFAEHQFFTPDGQAYTQDKEEIIRKFKAITGISERRYADPTLNTSDIAAIAAQRAIEDSGIDPESLDQIIMAHNFGDVKFGTTQSDAVPSLGNRVKHQLGIKNPACVAYDVLFGCPGWIQGVIQAHAFMQAGMARRILVIGAETLSRVVDESDRDTMIFSDGAGAAVLEWQDGKEGFLGYAMASHSGPELDYLFMGTSCRPHSREDTIYIKMLGRKIYEYALTEVPAAMEACLQHAGIGKEEVKKIFIHQANEKMDEAIIRRFYGSVAPPEHIMPMSIGWLGNSSVATVITLYDMVLKGKMPEHRLEPGDVVLFASVGAGMNINAFAYRA